MIYSRYFSSNNSSIWGQTPIAKKILNAEPTKQKYILGGSKRYNCCDWVSKVLGKVNKNYGNPNPKPFGDKNVPWWIPNKKIGWLINKFQ